MEQVVVHRGGPDAAGEGDGPHTGGRSHLLGERASLALGQQFQYHAGGVAPSPFLGIVVTSGVWGAANGVEAAGAPFGGGGAHEFVDGHGQGFEIHWRTSLRSGTHEGQRVTPVTDQAREPSERRCLPPGVLGVDPAAGDRRRPSR